MSALTGAIARVEQRVEAWENHYLPHIIDRIPVYVPSEEDRIMRDQETPHLLLCKKIAYVTNVHGWCRVTPLGQQSSHLGRASEGKGMAHTVRVCAVCLSGMRAHYPRSLTYYSPYRLIALFSRRFGSLRPLFCLFLVLPLLLVFPLSSLLPLLLLLSLHVHLEARRSLRDVNLPCVKNVCHP